MDITPVIVTGILVLVIVWAILHVTVIKPRRKRKSHKLWQDTERAKWLEKYKAAQSSDTELARVQFPHDSWANAETDHAVEKIKQARSREDARILAEHTTVAVAFYDSLRRAPNARARWKLLKNPPYVTYDINDGETSVWDHKKQAMVDYAELLLTEARDGNVKSFRKLDDLVHAGEYDSDGYHRNAKQTYSFPDDWDELLTRFVKDPSVEQFHNQREYAPNEILLLATEAMRTQNFIVAKLVLAYSMEERHHESGSYGSRHSQKYWPFRAAVGEFLLTELAAMVDAVHLQRGLFQEAVATPVTE